MRGQLILTAAATCILASSAFAQTTKAQSSKKAGSIKLAQATRPAPAAGSESAATIVPDTQATVPPTLGGPAAPNTPATSIASVETTVPKKSPFGFTFYTRADAGDSSIQKGVPVVTGINRFYLKYKLDDTQQVQARGVVTYDYANAERQGAAHIGDTYLAYTNSKVATLPADLNLTFEGRFYAPTGERSRFITKQSGAAYTLVTLGRSFGKFNASWWGDFFYNFNTIDAFESDVVDPTTKAVTKKLNANDHYLWSQYLEFGYEITPKFSIYHDIGTQNTTKRSFAGTPVQREDAFYNETYIVVSPFEKVSLIGSVANSAVFAADNSFELYKSDEVTYRAIMTLSL